MKNRVLWDAFWAAVNIGGLKKVPSSLGFEIALVKNHLTTVYESMNETRVKMVDELKVHGLKATDDDLTTEQRRNLATFDFRWSKFLDEEYSGNWAPPLVINGARFLNLKEPPEPNDLAALVTIKAVTVPPREEQKDED